MIANRYLGHVHFSVGDYGQAVLRLQASLSSLQEEVIQQHFNLPYKSSIAVSAWLAVSLAELGRFTEAIDIARHGIAEARPPAMPTASPPRPAVWALPCCARATWRRRSRWWSGRPN